MGIIFLPSAVLLSGTKMIRLLGEHRLFSQISNNWAGRPLERYNLQTVLKYIRTTETAKGLRVNTRLLRKQYEKGEGLADQQIRELVLTNHTPLPARNYGLTPATMGSCFCAIP
jgi:hypothetical protein